MTTVLTLVQQLHRLGGVATRATLLEISSRREFRRAVSSGAIVRDSHGRYALPIAADALRQANRLAGLVSHRSAALHWGWEVKTVPDLPDVIDCMKSLPFDEALAIADSALRHRAVTKARLIRVAASIRGSGARQARRVAGEASGLAANPFESVFRAIALDVPGLDLRPQVVIADKTGQGRPDLVDQRRRWVVEAESHSWHSRRGALRRDCRRYTKLVLLGWRVLRFAWEDVMFCPDYVCECLIEAAAMASQQADRSETEEPAA